MSDGVAKDDRKSPAAPIPYADRHLPIGPAGYQQLAYSADYAGFFNPAKCVDDGIVLRLQPGPPWPRLIAALGLAIAFASLAIFLKYAQVSPSRRPSPRQGAAVVILILGVMFGLPALCASGRREHKPWIEVDRAKKRVILPRARTMIAYDIVIRLQLVSFGKVGVSPSGLGYHGEPPSGELQIVFHHEGKTQTRSVVVDAPPRVLQRFAEAFVAETGVPVSRVIRLVSGDWVARPLI